jgi:MFS family permease
MSTTDARSGIVSDVPVELASLSHTQIDEGTVEPSAGSQDAPQTTQYPRGIRLVLITVGLVLSIFLAALDSTIIATAIPSITTQFGSISNIAWYGSSYSITNTAIQSAWGKAYQFFDLKAVFLCAIAVFEVGNVICATAPSSEVLILGRIVAGIGGGGVMTGAFIIIAMTAGPDHRATYMGVLGVTFGCASVVGPLMGGALTDGPGWRWCFWYATSIMNMGLRLRQCRISLPIGFAAALTMFLCFKSPGKPKEVPLREKILNLDLNGAALLSGCFSCFVLAMHWIGINPWSSARVIGSFVGFAALFICFLVNEWIMGSKAMVQAHLFKNRLVFANLWYAFFLAGAFFPLMYTLPIQFQSVNNNSASQSGIRLIPLVMGVSVFTMISNGLLTFWRHYKPFFLIGALFAVAGNSRIYMLDASTPTKAWVGYELLTAAGVGLALQIPMIANQALVPAYDLGAATTMSLFMENCGTVLFVASGEAAFTNGLLASLARNLPQIDARVVLDAGVTQIRSSFSGNELDKVLGGYLDGCKTSHVITVACGAIAGVISLSNAGPAAVKEVRMRLKKSHER